MTGRILYVHDPDNYHDPQAAHIAHIPAGISTKSALLDALPKELRFPEYFGRNWDALVECLRDLSWLPLGRVVLVHDALPQLDEENLRTYVQILESVIRDGEVDESRELVIIFGTDDRTRIAYLLSTDPRQSR